jgi:hypothetical protein
MREKNQLAKDRAVVLRLLRKPPNPVTTAKIAREGSEGREEKPKSPSLRSPRPLREPPHTVANAKVAREGSEDREEKHKKPLPSPPFAHFASLSPCHHRKSR